MSPVVSPSPMDTWSPETQSAWLRAWKDQPDGEQGVRCLKGWLGAEMTALIHPPLPGPSLVQRVALRQGQVPSPEEHAARQQQAARRQALLHLCRQTLEAAGDRWRSDMVELLHQAEDPEHPWRLGTVDAVTERQGKLHLLICQLPPGEPGAEGWASVTSEQAQMQAHHEGLLARAVGVKIAGLHIVHLDPQTWQTHLTAVNWDDDLAQRLTAAGDLQWQRVLGGEVMTSPPTVKLPGDPATHPDWDELSVHFLAYSLLGRQSETLRNQLGESLEQTLSAQQFSADVDQVAVGPARLKVDRVYREDKMLDVARQLLTQAGHDESVIEQVLSNPNLTTPATYNVDRLIDLVNMLHNSDVRQDPRYADAIQSPAQPNVKTLLAFIHEMDVERTVDYGALLDQEKSTVRLELPRGAVSGPQAKARERLLERMAPRLTELARELALNYPGALAQAQAEAPSPAAPRRRRQPT